MGTRVASASHHYPDKSHVGVTKLLDDLTRLLDDSDSADIIFIIGREEAKLTAHKLILKLRWALDLWNLVSILSFVAIAIQNWVFINL